MIVHTSKNSSVVGNSPVKKWKWTMDVVLDAPSVTKSPMILKEFGEILRRTYVPDEITCNRKYKFTTYKLENNKIK